jgi:hypothetical protein
VCIHLQGCLGWDKAKERVQGSYAATVTSDKWLVLAARMQHVLSGLKRCQDLASAEVIPTIAAYPGERPGGLERKGYLASSISEALDTLQGNSPFFRFHSCSNWLSDTAPLRFATCR